MWVLHLFAVAAFHRPANKRLSTRRAGETAHDRLLDDHGRSGLHRSGLGGQPRDAGADVLQRRVPLPPLLPVRDEVRTAFGCLAAVTLVGAVAGHVPWVVFPLACLVALWARTGGPERSRRKHARYVQRKTFH